MLLNKLTPEQEKVILKKGTEAPGSGEYNKFFEDGIYVCRRCNTPLYTSDSKFDSHCGWPSFDAEITGQVKYSLDADGLRTEISCTTCGAHLGHVFMGEKLTPKDTRHCVNSMSLKFMPQSRINKSETAVLGGGCFWCLDAAFRRLAGVISVESGYAGGQTENPSYEKVSAGQTGHAEVVKIEYDPIRLTYRELLKMFFKIHDPTTLNRQGSDVGEQYRSVIFYLNDEQKLVAEDYIKELTADKVYDRPIVTEIKPLQKFYAAEDYHQDYFAKHPENAYCQAVIRPKLEKI